LEERFWSKVDQSGDCWEWTGATVSYGYGVIKMPRNGRMWRAHRVAWLLTVGDPGDRLVLHRCDNPPCVRPDHLFLGDHRANTRDAMTKVRLRTHPENLVPGYRGPKGEKHHKAKLSVDDVRTIRELCAGGRPQQAVADQFGIRQSTVWAIVQRITWKEVMP
jgi:predicted DNA-binding protein (UPF0251 family)